MAKGELTKYSVQFAIETVEYYHWLTKQKQEYVMSKQLLRCGTSIGANIHEANYAVSKADFISKMQIALKESSETEYWMYILKQTGYFDPIFMPMTDHLKSIKRMLVSTLNTAKQN